MQEHRGLPIDIRVGWRKPFLALWLEPNCRRVVYFLPDVARHKTQRRDPEVLERQFEVMSAGFLTSKNAMNPARKIYVLRDMETLLKRVRRIGWFCQGACGGFAVYELGSADVRQLK